MSETSVKMILINLDCKKRDDGSYFITSPEVPLFSAVGKDADTALGASVEIIGGMLERILGVAPISVELIESAAPVFTPNIPHVPPSYVIAQMAT